jgi:hypothetical protein
MKVFKEDSGAKYHNVVLSVVGYGITDHQQYIFSSVVQTLLIEFWNR